MEPTALLLASLADYGTMANNSATLYLGGTSALASTFFTTLVPSSDDFIVCGPEPPRPGSAASRFPFVALDLTDRNSVRTVFDR